MPSNFFKWTDNDGVEHVLSGDLVESSLDNREVEMTQYAVETGSIVSDHVVRRQDTLQFELLQSQAPVYALPSDGANFSSAEVTVLVPEQPGQSQQATSVAVPTQPGSVSILGLGLPVVNTGAQGSTDFVVNSPVVNTGQQGTKAFQFHAFTVGAEVDRIRDIHNRLLDLLDNSYVTEVTFRGYTVQSMILTACRSSSQPGELGIGRFSLTFTKLNTVTTQEGDDLPAPNEIRLQGTTRRTKKGLKTGKKTVDEYKTAAFQTAEFFELPGFEPPEFTPVP